METHFPQQGEKCEAEKPKFQTLKTSKSKCYLRGKGD